jgi:tRNA U55 pseudouridine synthase TruB
MNTLLFAISKLTVLRSIISKENQMYKIYAHYEEFDRKTGDRYESHDLFKADTKEAADKIVEGLDKTYYDYIEIKKVI